MRKEALVARYTKAGERSHLVGRCAMQSPLCSKNPGAHRSQASPDHPMLQLQVPPNPDRHEPRPLHTRFPLPGPWARKLLLLSSLTVRIGQRANSIGHSVGDVPATLQRPEAPGAVATVSAASPNSHTSLPHFACFEASSTRMLESDVPRAASLPALSGRFVGGFAG